MFVSRVYTSKRIIGGTICYIHISTSTAALFCIARFTPGFVSGKALALTVVSRRLPTKLIQGLLSFQLLSRGDVNLSGTSVLA